MLVNIEGVAQPPHDGIRAIVPYVYTSQDERETPSEVRDANHAREIVRRLCVPESVFVDAKPSREKGYDPMWIVQISVLGTRQKITRYRTGYHKYDGCPLAAIGYMMDIYHAIKRILKNSRKELEKERQSENLIEANRNVGGNAEKQDKNAQDKRNFCLSAHETKKENEK